MLDTEAYKEFVQLSIKKKNLETELDEIKKDMTKRMAFLIDNLQSEEMDSIKISGKNCYINKITVARISNRADAIKALKKAGFSDYVKDNINAQSISKLVRDLMKDQGCLPDEFNGVISPIEIESLRIKSA